MSYILDALKKSDQERQQGSNPTIQTIQRSHVSSNDHNLWRWIAIVMAMILLIGLGFYSWNSYFNYNGSKKLNLASDISDDQQRLETGPEEPAAIQIEPASSDRLAAEKADAKETYTNIDAADNIARVASSSSHSVNEPTENSLQTLAFWELPDTVQQEIPALTFSFHVYSKNPERRTIIINKRRIKEGGLITKDLVLREITEKGVVIDWESEYRFSIDIVENW